MVTCAARVYTPGGTVGGGVTVNDTEAPSPREVNVIGAPAGSTRQPSGGTTRTTPGPDGSVSLRTRTRTARGCDAPAPVGTIASVSSKATVTAGTIARSRRISPRTAS